MNNKYHLKVCNYNFKILLLAFETLGIVYTVHHLFFVYVCLCLLLDERRTVAIISYQIKADSKILSRTSHKI